MSKKKKTEAHPQRKEGCIDVHAYVCMFPSICMCVHME